MVGFFFFVITVTRCIKEEADRKTEETGRITQQDGRSGCYTEPCHIAATCHDWLKTLSGRAFMLTLISSMIELTLATINGISLANEAKSEPFLEFTSTQAVFYLCS